MLTGVKVLVTRPVHQTDALVKGIRDLGGDVLLFPTIEIVDPVDVNTLLSAMADLATFDVAIFVSANAVRRTVDRWPSDPPVIKIAAIGPATKAACEAFQLSVDYFPESEFSSEGLLTLPAFSSVAGKQIVIFSGEGGRPLLADTLRSRGAKVAKVAVYRRVCPAVPPTINSPTSGSPAQEQSLQAKTIPDWPNAGLDIIISTSNESLQNLLTLVEQKAEWLKQMPLLVVSRRMEQFAKTVGFVTIITAANATDEAVLNAIVQHKEML